MMDRLLALIAAEFSIDEQDQLAREIYESTDGESLLVDRITSE